MSTHAAFVKIVLSLRHGKGLFVRSYLQTRNDRLTMVCHTVLVLCNKTTSISEEVGCWMQRTSIPCGTEMKPGCKAYDGCMCKTLSQDRDRDQFIANSQQPWVGNGLRRAKGAQPDTPIPPNACVPYLADLYATEQVLPAITSPWELGLNPGIFR